MERLIKIGEIKPKKSCEIAHSRIGLGFEKLDRNIFDPNKAYPFVGESGVKWARLQSGWMRTEKEKGVYDFAWLDDIVDHMIAMGVEPWLPVRFCPRPDKASGPRFHNRSDRTSPGKAPPRLCDR